MELEMLWVIFGVIQLLAVGIMTIIIVFFFKKFNDIIGSDVTSEPLRIMIVTNTVVGCTVILINFIVGPVWFSDVERWVVYILSGVSAGAVYGTMRLALKSVSSELMKTIARLETDIEAQP